MNNRVLIIGLDGATWTVLSPWIENGSLPNLARLQKEGCWGELRSTIPPLTAPAWSSFLTGKNPGKHGVFHFIPLDDAAQDEHAAQEELAAQGAEAEAGAAHAGADEGEQKVVDARSIQSATLWDILGHHGRKAGAINVPMSYPPRPINGFMVTCLLTPPNASIFTYPPELSRRLSDYEIDLDRFIDQKPFARDLSGAKIKRVVKPSLQLIQEFYDMEEKRARAALELMDTQSWDTFMVVFTATDRMGHYLWPYHQDPGQNAPEEDQSLHQALYRFYKRLDEHIGMLVEKAGEGASVLVMSDHGMGPIYSKNTHWNNWLYKNGYLAVDRGSRNTFDAWLLKLGIPRDSIRRLVRRIPGLYKSKVVQKAKTVSTAKIDYRRTQAYFVKIFDPVGGISINAEGPQREELRDELMMKIRDVVDPATGERIVRKVYRREDVYWGPYAGNLPDIILLMKPEYGSSNRLSSYSAIVTDRPEIGDPGGHHLEGIFIAHGPAVRAHPQPLEGLTILDLAPTILYLLGLPVPEDMDGRVLTEILDPAVLQGRPVASGPVLERWPSEAEAQPILEDLPGDDEIVYDRLRALGYVK